MKENKVYVSCSMYQNAYQVSSENAKERYNLNDQVVVGVDIFTSL